MPSLYVKQSGVWKQVQVLWAKQSGVWKQVSIGLVTQGGIGKQFYPDTVGPTNYNVAGTYTYTVPVGVTSITAAVTGGGGGVS